MSDPVVQHAAAIRAEWALDPGVTYLNHGGYGAVPTRVLEVQRQWRDRIERNPTRFLSRQIGAALRDAAAKVAPALGAGGNDLVFVENATVGINAVLRSLDLAAGDEILIASLAYPAIRKAAGFIAESRGARLVEAPIARPVRDADAVRQAFAQRMGARTRLVIVDHIASASALVLPVAAIVADAQRAGARVLIDGAHAPGQVALDLPALGADWYVGNLHKWYFAPRACGFVWACAAAQAGLHPLAISHGLGEGFAAEFDWTGTRDFTAALAAPAGIAFHQSLGGAALMARNQALARDAAAFLAQTWETATAGPPEMFAAMASVRLPIGGDATPERARHLAQWLAQEHHIETAISAEGGALWVRVAAQAYNAPADYETLAAVIAGSNSP